MRARLPEDDLTVNCGSLRSPRKAKRRQISCLGNGGEGWIRTSVRLRGQIYSLLPLTTRPPLHEVTISWQARHMAARQCRVNAGEREELSPLR